MSSAHSTRRGFLKAIGLGAASFAVPSVLRAAERSASRPNIVLIMVDDMGFSDIGCYGGEIRTPNLDNLAKGGLRFTHFYNAARCCPTRASLMTGLYPHQAGMGDMVTRGGAKPGPYQGYLNDRCVTIAEALRNAGYTTLMSGKWHVGEDRPHWPVDRGFDKYYGLISGGANYYDITKGKRKGVKRNFAIDDQPVVPDKNTFFMTHAISDNAVRFLDTHGRRDNPFFIYVAYTAPHWPLHALPEDIARYKGTYMKGWDVLRKQRYERQLEMGIIDRRWPVSPRDNELTPWEEIENKEEMDLKMAVYAAQIDEVDQGVGRICRKLEELGKWDNTLILFLSDNGGCHEGGPLGFDNRQNGLPPGGVDSYMSYGRSWANASNTPFRMFKHWVHEGGIATPLIAHWPEVIEEHGRITDQPGHVIDIMATCCDVAGTSYPKMHKNKTIVPLEGKSLAPIFQGKQRKGHDAICWEHEGNRAIRIGKWKLVAKETSGPWELYNMEADRTELNDLARKEPERVKEMAAMWQAYAERTKALPWPKTRKYGFRGNR